MTNSASPSDQLFFAFQQTLAGRYSIDRELGRGGMGIVFLAREVHLDRMVAIKLLPPEKASQPQLRERFLSEVRLAAGLSHPNIIPIHAVEEAGGFVFYVMAFIDGETLSNRVRARGPLPGSEGARVLREVAWALGHAHGQGFVHRDVKPDNILIENGTGRVLVADFGIAAAMGAANADGISGTPEFMSPEQVLGGQIDGRSDIYGLGATAFFTFSGRFPFEGNSATEVLAKQVTEPPPPLASLGLSVSRKLASIVDRCLAKEPDRRPASAEALAEQLGVALEHRKELPAALRAFVKRNSRLDGGGTLIAGTLLVLIPGLIAAITGNTTYGFAAITIGAISAPYAYFVAAARGLLLLGFDHKDLAAAFKAEIEQAGEELSAENRVGSPAMARLLPLLRWTTVAAITTGVGAKTVQYFGLLRQYYWVYDGLYPAHFWTRGLILDVIIGVSAVVAMAAGVGAMALLQQRRDVDTEFWSRFWVGRVGKSAFARARLLIGKRVLQSAMTHRATELSLGLAAEQLFESLPKETRLALGGLPELLQRLQADAQTLRRQYETASQALADVGEGADPAYAEVRQMRDSAHAKLGEAVGALETIRLNLLRLHAGSTTVESLTTHLGIAREVSEEVERLIAAHGDVDQIMKFPRLAASTPI